MTHIADWARKLTLWLSIMAILLVACGEDTITVPPPPEFPDPVYYAIEQGINGFLLGWSRVSEPFDTTSNLWRAECFLAGDPHHEWLLLDRDRAAGGLDWRLGPDPAGPFRRGRIADDGSGWAGLLTGWGDLALHRDLLDPGSGVLVLSIHSPLGPAQLGLRWEAAGRPASMALDFILLAEPDAAPLPRQGILHHDGVSGDDGADTELFRLVSGDDTVFIRLFRDNFPAPWAVWWEEFGIYLQFWDDVMPNNAEDAFDPSWPAPAGYAAETGSFNAGDLDLAREIFRPEGEGPFPALLMLADEARADRNDAAAFGHLAHRLAGEGWLVHRYDKAGSGMSPGDPDSLDLEGRRRTIAAAWQAMIADPDCDPLHRALLGHGEGAALALEFAAGQADVASVLALSPLLYDPDMLASIPEAEGSDDWVEIHGLNCFTGKHRDLMSFDSDGYLDDLAWSGRRVALYRAEADTRLSADELLEQESRLTAAGALVTVESFEELGLYLTTGRADSAPPLLLRDAVSGWLGEGSRAQ
jgi:hypothetical protein